MIHTDSVDSQSSPTRCKVINLKGSQSPEFDQNPFFYFWCEAVSMKTERTKPLSVAPQIYPKSFGRISCSSSKISPHPNHQSKITIPITPRAFHTLSKNVRKQSSNRSTLLRLPLRINPRGLYRVIRKCTLASEVARLLTNSDSVEEIVNVDPDALQCLAISSVVCRLE